MSSSHCPPAGGRRHHGRAVDTQPTGNSRSLATLRAERRGPEASAPLDDVRKEAAAIRQADAATIRLHQAMSDVASADPDLRAILAHWSIVHAAAATVLLAGARLPHGEINHHEALLSAAEGAGQRIGGGDLRRLFADANLLRPIAHRARYGGPRTVDAGHADRCAELASRIVEEVGRRCGHGISLAPLCDMASAEPPARAAAWVVYSARWRPGRLSQAVAQELGRLHRAGTVVGVRVHADQVAAQLELAHTHLARATTLADDASLVAQFAWMATMVAVRALLLAHRVDIAHGGTRRDEARLDIAGRCVRDADSELAEMAQALYGRHHRITALGRYDHPTAVPSAAAWSLFADIWPLVADFSQRAQELCGGFLLHTRAVSLPRDAQAFIMTRARGADDHAVCVTL